jgi:hypothetical protein
MKKQIFKKINKIVFPEDTVEVKIFQNKNNHQFNLPVLKKSTSPQIIKDILANKDVIGLKFKITDLIFKKNSCKEDIKYNEYKTS